MEATAMDRQEAIWLAWLRLREELGPDADDWTSAPGVEVRPDGWVVCFPEPGPFRAGDTPQSRRFRVFDDRTVDPVGEHDHEHDDFGSA
jgi:hypothetical protein